MQCREVLFYFEGKSRLYGCPEYDMKGRILRLESVMLSSIRFNMFPAVYMKRNVLYLEIC